MSRTKRKSESQLLSELKAATGHRGGLTDVAARLGFTIQFLSDVVNERRPVSERLAESMGYRKVVEYEEAR
jgi:predicted transcriptional regulator